MKMIVDYTQKYYDWSDKSGLITVRMNRKDNK